MINHPNIINYYFSCQRNNNLYIAMEFCQKKDLQNYINDKKDKNEKISEDKIWKVAYQTLDALQYLHVEKKIVHQDIKPLNLMIDDNDNIKLTDFGFSGIMPIISNI